MMGHGAQSTPVHFSGGGGHRAQGVTEFMKMHDKKGI